MEQDFKKYFEPPYTVDGWSDLTRIAAEISDKPLERWWWCDEAGGAAWPSLKEYHGLTREQVSRTDAEGHVWVSEPIAIPCMRWLSADLSVWLDDML